MAKLTATGVRNAGAGAKSYKLADGGGLYLFVTTKGAGYWRYDYRFAGARKTLALGVYPEVGLKDARERHAGAREMLANNPLIQVHRRNSKSYTLMSKLKIRSPQ